MWFAYILYDPGVTLPYVLRHFLLTSQPTPSALQDRSLLELKRANADTAQSLASIMTKLNKMQVDGGGGGGGGAGGNDRRGWLTTSKPNGGKGEGGRYGVEETKGLSVPSPRESSTPELRGCVVGLTDETTGVAYKLGQFVVRSLKFVVGVAMGPLAPIWVQPWLNPIAALQGHLWVLAE